MVWCIKEMKYAKETLSGILYNKLRIKQWYSRGKKKQNRSHYGKTLNGQD